MKGKMLFEFYPDVDPAFGNWVAGFSDGEGCFTISVNPTSGSHRCQFRIQLRADDTPILNEICATTGIGYVRSIRKTRTRMNPMAEWIVIAKKDCEALVDLFTRFPLRAKKARDFAIWKRAVDVQSGILHLPNHGRRGSRRDPKQDTLATLRTELQAVRRWQ